MSEVEKVVAYYDKNAGDLALRYLKQKPEQLHAKLIAILDAQKPEGDILEIGGGVGRDADFFGQRYQGDVTVVEPSEGLLDQMLVHLTVLGYEMRNVTDESSPSLIKDGIEVYAIQSTLDEMADWMSTIDPDTIPQYTFINVNAVWQHQPVESRTRVADMLSDMLEEGGIISVKGRNKPSEEQVGIAWDVSAEELVEQFGNLDVIEIEEQEDFSKPGSDLKFISAIFRKPKIIHGPH